MVFHTRRFFSLAHKLGLGKEILLIEDHETDCFSC